MTDNQKKLWDEMKAKHPEALLLFRCGDFYEAYCEDAKECAKILGITLMWRTPTMRHKPGDYSDAMAGFPHHALDAYLPKLVRAGKRIAICDQLPDPPKPTVKRGETEKLNDQLPKRPNDKTTNNPNDQTTMAQNVKAADLIGKVIIVGNNQGTITVKSVQDNGMLACEFKKTDSDAVTPMTVTLPNLHKMQERGLWKIQSGECRTESVEFATAATTDMTTEADVQEVQDIVPVVTKKAEGRGKKEEVSQPSVVSHQPTAKVKPIGKPKQEKPKTKTQTSAVSRQPSAISPQTSYVYSTYQTSKGKTGAKITGVSETDAAYQQAAAIHASGSYTKDKDGNKHFYLCFGPRYAEAAKKVCELLNAGKPIEDAIAVVNAATEERATKREEWKQKREERKAAIEREQNGTRSSSAEREQARPKVKAQSSKDYSKEDVAEMLRKVLAGGDVPEDIKALLQAA